MKCPQLSKPEATTTRNQNSIGDRMEKQTLGETRLSREASSPLARRTSSLFHGVNFIPSFYLLNNYPKQCISHYLLYQNACHLKMCIIRKKNKKSLNSKLNMALSSVTNKIIFYIGSVYTFPVKPSVAAVTLNLKEALTL